MDARDIVYGMPYEEWKARYQHGPKQDPQSPPPTAEENHS